MTDEVQQRYQLDYSAVEALLAVLGAYPAIPDGPDNLIDPAPVNEPPTLLDELFLEIQGQLDTESSTFKGRTIWTEAPPRILAAHYSHMFGDDAKELLKLHAALSFGQGYTARALCYVMAGLITDKQKPMEGPSA